MMSIKDKKLWDKLADTINTLDESNDLVVCSGNNTDIVKKIYEAVSEITPQTSLSTQEMYGVRSLLLEAIGNKDFFDWEMPTLTGFTAEQFEDIANKLPRE